MENKNIKPKTQNRNNKIVNYELMPKREDIAVIETLIENESNKEQEMVVTQEQIQDAIVYDNNVTSIDFMMPEEEREILEKNLNIYSDIKKMQTVLAEAKKNKKLSEDIKSLGIISKEGDLANKLLDVMSDDASIEVLLKSFKEKMEKGESGKAYKELATAYKIIMDARQEKIKQLNAQKTGKSARIALKFQNDSGEEVQLGVEI